MLPDDRELRDIQVPSAAVGAPALFDTTIRPDRVRNVWRLSVSFLVLDTLTIFAGDAALTTRRIAKVIEGAANTTYERESEDGKTPVLKIRPRTSTALVEENQVYIGHLVAIRNVQMIYSDDLD